MEARIKQAVGLGGGLITTAQVRALGVDDRVAAQMVRHGALRSVRRGVLTTPDHWDALDAHAGRPLLEVRAARMTMRHRHVLSHDSSALANALPLIDPSASAIHFNREDLRATKHRAGVFQHAALYAPL